MPVLVLPVSRVTVAGLGKATMGRGPDGVHTQLLKTKPVALNCVGKLDIQVVAFPFSVQQPASCSV